MNSFPGGHHAHSMELDPMADTWTFWGLDAKGPSKGVDILAGVIDPDHQEVGELCIHQGE